MTTTSGASDSPTEGILDDARNLDELQAELKRQQEAYAAAVRGEQVGVPTTAVVRKLAELTERVEEAKRRRR